MQQQAIYKCWPGWSPQDNEPGCLHCPLFCLFIPVGLSCYPSVSLHRIHLKTEQSPLNMVIWVGRDRNECTVDSGGCQNQCCNTAGHYHCKCQAGRKLEEDGRGCEERESMSQEKGREREREGEREYQADSTLSTETNAGLNPQPWDHDLSRNQDSNAHQSQNQDSD